MIITITKPKKNITVMIKKRMIGLGCLTISKTKELGMIETKDQIYKVAPHDVEWREISGPFLASPIGFFFKFVIETYLIFK